jgi:hypothetical protein
MREDEVIGYTQLPDLACRHAGHPLNTDARGARSEHAGSPAPSQVDMLATGCSFTWGDGVEYADTYPALVAKALGRREYNVAHPGYGTTTSLLSLERFSDVKRKVIVYGFINEHIRRSIVPCAAFYSPCCRAASYVTADASGGPSFSRPTGRARRSSGT